MDKDEVKNKISMALKDPILQQGFEIICKALDTEKQLNAEIKARFVKCNTCTDEMKSKCLMFSENLCQGERCEELVDLISLLNKSELQKENEKLKEQVSYLKDNLRVARKDREDLQLDVAKGLKEFVKDYPATAFRYLANEKYVEKLTKAKDLLVRLSSCLESHSNNNFEYELLKEAEQFLKEE